jgi:hypothetical protein
MKTYARDSKFTELKNYCHMSSQDDFMEITEWHNGEGFDIVVSNKNNEQRFSLTHGQYECLQAMIAYRG